MDNNTNITFKDANTPRWIVFTFDVFVSIFAITFAYLLRFNFQIPEAQSELMLYGILFVVGVRSLTFIFSKLYAGIIRHTTIHDTERILVVLTVGSLIAGLLNFISPNFTGGSYVIPYTVLVIELFLVSLLFFVSRVLAKGIYWRFVAPRSATKYVVIYGINNQSMALKQVFQSAYDPNSEIIAFLSDNPKTVGKKFDGVDIFHYSKFEQLIEQYEVSDLLIADTTIDAELKNSLVEMALGHGVKSYTVPKVSDWIKGSNAPKQIRKVKIEDLLERKPIKLDEKNISSTVKGKTVMVTGAAGSIGSEICRQLTRFNPARIILVDQAESPLYDIELELKEEFKFLDVKVIIGDITQLDKMTKIFQTYQPQIIYHAAAYKHVPMMEHHPDEAVWNNILGTKNIADLAHKFRSEKFVMVSTDKAVNPTNVMGASKRIAEIYTQALNGKSDTSFITTRFGNVLGSNGSVIPRFRKQIESGGPITITHPDITRYFMTIPEACQLVLEAGAIGNGGEILIFDMGQMVKIDDLARKMVKLAGLVPGKDILFDYTGLRPGEKLYEELLNVKENTLPTHNSRIMIARVREYSFHEVQGKIRTLIDVAKADGDAMQIVSQMKNLVPEFISNNSKFEKIDVELRTA